MQTRFKEGRPYRVWVLPPARRNEALDTAVYALAARHATRIRLDLAAAIGAAPVLPPELPEGAPPAFPPDMPPPTSAAPWSRHRPQSVLERRVGYGVSPAGT